MNEMNMNKINEINSRYILPTIEERTSYGYKRLDPYTKLFEERIIFLGQAIDDTVANDVMAQLLTLESMDPDRDIMMYINSPGGSFTALTAIYDTMQFVRPDVMTICLGQAASAAAILLAGGAAGKRYALEHARILIHQPYSEGGGQGSDIEIQAKEILRMRGLLEEMLAKHSKKSKEEIAKDIERDKILTSAEAVEYGLIDQVLASRKAKAKAQIMSKLAHGIESILFRARWLLVPLYVGLVGALILLIYRFGLEFVHMFENVADSDAHKFTLDLLALLDLTLLANLILIVIFAGYENFVSRIDIAHDSKDRPHWMGTIDFSGLKIKLIGSLVAISVIELLKDFIELSGKAQVNQGTIWRIVIHITFVVSGVLFALMDWIADKREFEGTH